MTDFKFVERHSVYKCPEYHFEIEELRRGSDQMLLAHIRVEQWSKKTFIDMVEKWRAFRTCVTAPLFAFALHDDDKWERFVRFLGFKPLSIIFCNDGSPRRLFIHVKDFPDGVFTGHQQAGD
jgi:nucleoside-diphosphate-sugar epimerase